GLFYLWTRHEPLWEVSLYKSNGLWPISSALRPFCSAKAAVGSRHMQLLKAISNGENVDIIFLDINMDDMDGLSVAKRIREIDDDVPIILVTAFMNYAIDGYKVKASRFLIKDDLDKTFDECMDDICKDIRKKSKTIAFNCVEGEMRLKASDIILIETSGHKNLIKLKNETY
ncbi:MAG: response regulator, partial [Lachnospiraceae bacterium]|nr:response regulator [Lachnospiraceae bacterium]